MKAIAAAVAQSSDPEVQAWFPAYVRRPPGVEIGALKRLWFEILSFPGRLFIKLVLRPRRETAGALDPAEVDRVYDREAVSYDWKHHITTRGQDTSWRRMAGWIVASAPEAHPAVLDLCTGTGLTVVEMLQILHETGRSAAITGLDYNAPMLQRARARFGGAEAARRRQVEFVQGDATALVEGAPAGFATFARASFDIVTQMFGIGGIAEPLPVCNSALAVLREGGRFLLIDMHRPIPSLPGELPLPWTWQRMPNFEVFAYWETTIPLVLGRLWGWRDTTLDFYLAPLVCEREGDAHYGFRILWKNVESERWWLGFPLMPTCRLLLEKVRIEPAEYERRRRVLVAIGAEAAT